VDNKKNFVSLKDESIRMFDNPILDWFSYIHWTYPLIIWLPVVVFCLYMSIFAYNIGIQTILYGIIGFMFWTLLEYLMHRFVFHYHPSSEFGKQIHFVMHGVHHDYPNDSKRLVMPPIMSLLISIPFAFLFWYGFGQGGKSFAAFAGLVLGYLSYDMLHYAVHYAKWNWAWFERLKKHHMAHHYQHPESGFGVSNMFWDVIFGTTIEKARQERE
jgi:sterol desaturase/sphingolipid hydroxylase (fatty acid hydroxylase superfamily)